MPQVATTHYACFARWTYSAVDYAVGTDEGYRSGTNHDPVLTTDADLQTQFREGVVDGNTLTLTIADGIGGTYRTLVTGNVLDGTAVTVETVCTLTYDDGTTAEQTASQTLTVQGTAVEPGKVHLTLIDLEDARLATLYPSNTYTADLFRDLDGGFAGRAIPYPVGTCRKFTCPQLFADSARAQWFHSVCDASGFLTLTIAAINTGAKTFSVAGDYADRISAGTVIYANAASANPGRYTVTGAVFSTPNTVITVSETISSGTVSGALIVPPTVLAVYRDGRLVASSEYTVELAWPASGQLDDSDFDNSPAVWTAAGVGTGTATLTGGVARFTGDGTATNYGRVNYGGATRTALPRAYVLATLTLAAGSRARLATTATVTAGTVITSSGTHTAPVQVANSTGNIDLYIGNANTGSATTVDVDDLSMNTTHTLLMLRFVREQVGFDGRPYSIQADVRGIVSRNVADEISRLLTAAGATPDATSFAAAQTYATTHGMLVDVDHGRGDDREGGQRTLRALLDDLLFIARATLSRNSSGHWVITQDKTASTAETLDEDAGDLVEVRRLDQPPKPVSIGIRFAPNPRDPANLTYTITRTVSGGTLPAEQPRDVRYLTDATAADRLACYLALRAQYGARLKFRRWLAARTLGEVVNLTSTPTYPGARDWFIDQVQQIPGGVQCEARQYAAAVHTYSAGTLPNGATTAYQPDYSQTPPSAPTGMAITAGSVATANDGTMTARVTAKATPPSVNWAELWLTAIHNTTNEISALVRADSIGGGEYGATLTGLRPGEVYKLQSYAVNAFAVQGSVATTFNATAIGGGATDTTFTAPGQTTLPGDVASISATQRMGRIVEVTWTAVSAAALWGYVLEREVSGVWTEVWRGQATNYRDTDVTMATAYRYRVKARDTYGNVSANWATSGTVTPSGNVTGGSGGDLGTDTVETSNRTATNTFSVSYTNPGALQAQTQSLTHSLGKVPLLTIDTAGKASVLVTLKNVTTTAADVLIVGTGNGSTNPVSPTDPHDHLLLGFTEAGTVYVRVW
jgi:hypothetical protein